MELSRWLQWVLMSCVVTAAVFAGLVFPASVAAQSPPPDRQVAITIDDLPRGGDGGPAHQRSPAPIALRV